MMEEKGYQYDRAEMLMRQRDMAEEERDSWKVRAVKAEVERQALAATNTNLRDQLILAEGQRDQAKADAEYWKGEWAVVMGQLGGARAEVEAVKIDHRDALDAHRQMCESELDVLWVERYALRVLLKRVPSVLDSAFSAGAEEGENGSARRQDKYMEPVYALRKDITAAMAVQPSALVEQYRERAKRDDARIEELMQRPNHWHDVADMLKRQRDMAEEECEHWKLRAMRAEQERQALRDECEALRKVVADVRAIKKSDSPCRDGENNDWVDGWQYGYQAALEDVRECITAASPALAVQHTTGGEHE